MLRSAEALFLGSHVNKIDAKGRIAAPADFRRALDLGRFNGFFCAPSLIGPWLDCGGPDYIETLIAMIEALDPFDPDRADLEDALIGRARPVPFDGDGRFILPQPLRDHAKLDDAALLIGRGRTFQIRAAAGAEAMLDAAAARAKGALGKLKNPALAAPERAR